MSRLGGDGVIGSGGGVADEPARLEIDTPASAELNSTEDAAWASMNPEQARSIYTNTVIAAKCVFSGGLSGWWSSGDPILGVPALEDHSHNIASVTRHTHGASPSAAGTYRVTFQTPVHADAAFLVTTQDMQGGSFMSTHIYEQTTTYCIIECHGVFVAGGPTYHRPDPDAVSLIVVGAVAS